MNFFFYLLLITIIMFSEIKYDTSVLLNYFHKFFTNSHDLNTFLDLINKDYISISGSSILQIIQNECYDNCDIDIYIEINNFDVYKTIEISQLIIFLSNITLIGDNTKKKYISNILNIENMLLRVLNGTNTINQDSSAFSLKEYIKLYQLYENTQMKFKIELMFITDNIEKILHSTFDYDIVKNYWKQFKLYSLNKFAIQNKIATMSLSHFAIRILLGSQREFNNFIIRYNKYSKRGFKIYINTTHITSHILNHIIKMQNVGYYNSRKDYLSLKIEINQNKSITKKIYLRTIAIKINNKFDIHNKFKFYYEFYIINFILTAAVIQKKLFYKRLLNYINILNEIYLAPNSPFILYKGTVWNKQNNNLNVNNDNKLKIYYINNTNNIQFLLLKSE